MTRIRARIGGRDMTFQMTPDDLPAFEQMHGSAFGFYTRLVEGLWTVADLSAVLNFASMTEATRAIISKSARFGVAVASMTRADPHVRWVLSTHPVARYCPLASMILASAMFGISEGAAHFSDEEVK